MNYTLIHVKIKPNSAKNEILGWKNERLEVAISVPPVEGKANRELVYFFAEILSCPKSNITIIKGEISKYKTVRVEGADVSVLYKGRQENLL